MTLRKMRRQLPAGAPGLSLPRRNEGYLGAALFLLAIAALSALPASAEPQAADPHAPVPKARYRPIIEGYTPYRPVEPRPWKGVNREVAPKPKSQSEDKR